MAKEMTVERAEIIELKQKLRAMKEERDRYQKLYLDIVYKRTSN